MRAKQLNVPTTWHDNGTRIEVPAGEPVKVLEFTEVPMNAGRQQLRRDIETYAKRGRKCVPIKIRDWYALIDESSLCDDYCVVGVMKGKPLVPTSVPGVKLLTLF